MASAKNNIDDESSSNDDSSSSSSSSTDSTESQPQDDATAIRENAVRLLESSASKHGGGTRNNISNNNNTMSKIKYISYQSYQDAPTVTVPANTAAIPTSATPQWVGNNNNNINTTSIEENSAADGLSMTEVAFMAFNCVGTCLTETYRAASNYYNDYEQQQTPSISDIMNSRTHNYEQVSGYHHNTNESYNINKKNGYTDDNESDNNHNKKSIGQSNTNNIIGNRDTAS